MRYISKSEATTAITPAIGAIQNTRGSFMEKELNNCSGMYMFNNALPFYLYNFPCQSFNLSFEQLLSEIYSNILEITLGCIFKRGSHISNKNIIQSE